MTKKRLTLKINNIGPNKDIVYETKLDKLKLALFANNGTGKTFISRSFRLFENLDYDIKSLLTFGENQGEFEVNYNNQIFKIEIKDNSISKIYNESNILFHVFNTDFIDENLEVNGYKINNEIEGYILGKSNIDLTKDKKEINDLKSSYDNLCLEINNLLEESKNNLVEQFSINRRLAEFKAISFDNISTENNDSEDELNKEFILLSQNFNNLSSMPENLNDVKLNDFNINIDYLKDIHELLSNSYSKATNLSEKVSKYCKNNDEFILKGMEIFAESNFVCPFCNQKIDENSEIISNYNIYINDEESKIIQKIKIFKNNIDSSKNNISLFYDQFSKVNSSFEEIKSYLPNFEEKLFIPDKLELIKLFDNLNGLLDFKIKDVSKNFYKGSNDLFNNITNFIFELNKNIQDNQKKIKILNERKNKISDERREIQRKLCNVGFLKFCSSEKDKIHELFEIKNEIDELNIKISHKEQKRKRDKKKEVAKTFKHFLNFFFKDKYTFNEETFNIKFNNENISNMSKVLSEGEKTIVAFCYYIASTHLIINKEEDYKKLFFIIDDPISSIDYNYIYSICRSIINLFSHFSLNKHSFLILTHNLNFMNMLIKNKVIDYKFYLKNQKIDEFNSKLLLPYENHLEDIINVFKKDLKPSHTTPNSIRQVLEHILYFEQKYSKLNDFVSEDPILSENNNLYYLINDLSHRADDILLPNDEIEDVCKTVLHYLNENYPGQLKDKGINI